MKKFDELVESLMNEKYDKKREYKVVQAGNVKDNYVVMLMNKGSDGMTIDKDSKYYKKPEDALKDYPDAEVTDIKLENPNK